MTGPGPTAGAPAILSVGRLSFSWRDRPVLRGIDLSLASGTILALLGPNGAGKSTLIRCICGRLRPDAGFVRLAGDQPLNSRAARAAIGLVPQQIALYPHLTVRENLNAFSRLAGLDRSAAMTAVARTVELCDLAGVVNELAGKLSGGWQRRVNIASALSHAPRLLILDEPTVGIDPPAREAIEVLLRRLADDGLAVLMTSHDLAQLESLVDQLAFLADGQIAAAGTPADLIAQFFGAARDCRVRLATAVDLVLMDRLSALGLQQIKADPRTWSGLLPGEAASQLQAELAGVSAVVEFRARQPGLATLWARLYGRDPEAET
ncbi:MAG: ABC transporter ATP-binding protein [Wenzhouxiangella sp.]